MSRRKRSHLQPCFSFVRSISSYNDPLHLLLLHHHRLLLPVSFTSILVEQFSFMTEFNSIQCNNRLLQMLLPTCRHFATTNKPNTLLPSDQKKNQTPSNSQLTSPVAHFSSHYFAIQFMQKFLEILATFNKENSGEPFLEQPIFSVAFFFFYGEL